MMPPERHRAKVILGATCFADAEAALQLAVSLAQQISADLHGCLVADDAILASVAVPKAQVVTYSGRRFDNVTQQSMQTAFHADARLFQQRLLSAARKASLEAAFSERRGQLSSLMTPRGDTSDLVIFGFRRAAPLPEGVVAVFGATAPDPDLLRVSAALARSRRMRLTVIADHGAFAEIKAQLAQTRSADVVLVAAPRQVDVLATLEKMRPLAVFVGDDPSNAAWVRRLIDAARCPVVVPVAAEAGVL